MFKLISSPVLRQYAVAIVANLTALIVGMNVVWGSPMLIKLRDENQTILARPPTEDEEAWIVSIGILVGLAGIIVAGNLVDWFGRKTMLVVMFVPRVIQCFIQLFATEIWMLLLARAFGGLSDISSISIVSIYVSEVVGKEIRGASGTATQIMSSVGTMIMFSVGPYVSYLAVNIMMTGIVAVAIIPVIFLPESPYFLYVEGRTTKAVEVLTLLRGTEQLAHDEIKEYTNTSDEELDKLSVLKDRTTIKTFTLVIFLTVLMQFIGHNAVSFYLQSIFETTPTSISSEISSLIVGVVQLVACLCTFLVTDRFGRKPILCASLIGMSIGTVGLGSFFVVLENVNTVTGFLNYLPLISVILVIFGYNAGLGSLFWILVAELFEGPIRPYGLSCSVCVGALGTFLMTRFFPTLLSSIGAPGMYYGFAVSSLIFCLAIAFLVPETKGKTFVEIQKALGRKYIIKYDSKDIA